MKTLTLAALVAALAISMTGCDNGPDHGAAAKPKDTKLKTAYDACDVTSGIIELADGNTSILVKGAGATGTDGGGDLSQIYEDAVASLGEVNCLYEKLNTAEYILQEIQATTAMMGRQSEEDEGITYEWTYHPDTGLNMTMHES